MYRIHWLAPWHFSPCLKALSISALPASSIPSCQSIYPDIIIYVCIISAAAALIHILSLQGSHEHGSGTSDAAVYGNGLGRTVQLACAAFHTGRLADYFYNFPIGCKYSMGTNIDAHAAAIASFLLENQCIFYVGIKHFQILVTEMIIEAIKERMPEAAIHTIMGK